MPGVIITHKAAQGVKIEISDEVTIDIILDRIERNHNAIYITAGKKDEYKQFTLNIEETKPIPGYSQISIKLCHEKFSKSRARIFYEMNENYNLQRWDFKNNHTLVNARRNNI